LKKERKEVKHQLSIQGGTQRRIKITWEKKKIIQDTQTLIKINSNLILVLRIAAKMKKQLTLNQKAQLQQTKRFLVVDKT
jgi:hypothetical protein